MMEERKYLNWGLGLAVITAVILFIAKLEEKPIQIVNFIALAILVAILLLSPFFGFLILIPVFLLAWFKYYQDVLSFIQKLRG